MMYYFLSSALHEDSWFALPGIYVALVVWVATGDPVGGNCLIDILISM